MMSHIEDLKASWRLRSVVEKQDALLIALAEMSPHPGAGVPVSEECDQGLAWSESPEEFHFHMEAARQRGFFAESEYIGDAKTYLSPAGWNRVDELRKVDPELSDLVFVAMAFDKALLPAWVDGYEPGIRAAGYRPERVDTTPHADKIDDRIMAMIRASRFVVVDVTLQKCGAYFEAGFAMGLGRPVIWGVREDDLSHVHFDTRQFAHILWRTPAELAGLVKDKIEGMFGHGPVAK
jgi:hypothetical protein